MLKLPHIAGAHIGPEPTTDRFVVVMVVYLTLSITCHITRFVNG